MKSRKIVLRTTLMGYPVNIATIKVGSPATEAGLSDWTDLVCPEDKRKPKYMPSAYECECGFRASSWQKLTRVLKGTTKMLQIPKLAKGNGEVEVADMFRISMKDFIELGVADCIDSKDAEHPVLCDDKESAKNLFKTLVAQESGQSIIILRWNDTTEQVIAMLSLTPSGRIVLRKLIPKNLVRGLEAGLRLDRTAITESDVEQAKMFLKQLPEATEQTFEVNDYRTEQFSVIGQESNEDDKVVALAKILEKAGIDTGEAKVEKVLKASSKVKVEASTAKGKKKIPIPVAPSRPKRR